MNLSFHFHFRVLLYLSLSLSISHTLPKFVCLNECLRLNHVFLPCTNDDVYFLSLSAPRFMFLSMSTFILFVKHISQPYSLYAHKRTLS